MPCYGLPLVAVPPGQGNYGENPRRKCTKYGEMIQGVYRYYPPQKKAKKRRYGAFTAITGHI